MKTRVALIVSTLLFAAWAETNSAGQLKSLPGSAARGQALLITKGCLNCHGLDKWGANRAPDLTRTPRNAQSASTLAAALWNHAPEMWNPSANPPIQITSPESADLFAYFYSAFYFSLPGDFNRGRRVFEEKNCANCHSRESTAGKAGPPISSWVPVSDPTEWSERMWNHSRVMLSTMAERGISWPLISDQNVADLLVYLGAIAPRSATARFNLGEPERGKVAFERGCESCHSLGAAAGRRIDLLGKPAPRTVTGYIAEMWNHSPRMRSQNRDPLPALKSGEMADLIAYLFASRYFFEQGNPDRGRRVFENKSCNTCHGEVRDSGSPDLSSALEFYSPITMTSALWRHGPAMKESMQGRRISWPRFTDQEMTDLIAYLNSRLRIHVARD